MEYWKYQQEGKAKINQERIQILNEIGFEWDPQRMQWQTMFEKLEQFVLRYGHARVPKGHLEDRELANWVRNQRLEYRNWQQKKKTRMTAERFAKLDRLGFVWSHRTSSESKQKGDNDKPPSSEAEPPSGFLGS